MAVSQLLDLFILPPTEPTRILKQPEYKEVQRGRSVVFECTVKHDPSLIPTMTWLKDDGELPDDERSELFISGDVFFLEACC